MLIPWLDARAVRTRMKRHELTPAGALRSYRGTRDAGVLDVSDPLPALTLAYQTLGDRAGKGRRPQPSPAVAPKPTVKPATDL